jgi:hypothetical protein
MGILHDKKMDIVQQVLSRRSCFSIFFSFLSFICEILVLQVAVVFLTPEVNII